MKLLTITLLTTCTLLCGCCGSDCGIADASLDYAAINAQAAEQYLRPIRPGYEGRNPFWNGFAKKFIYAPAFDFDEVAGAANYRFTVVPLGEETQASWSFTADSPKAALTPVWGEIPVGRVRLTVEGLDASGKALGKAGEREFLRDYPFTGPYTPAVRDYRQAALMGLLYIHRMPEIQYWAEHTEPDMNYRHNTYPCKIIGATIRAEALLARLLPAHKEQATRIARNAAQFLIDQSRPAGDPLAFFPPTYYKDLIASKRTENQNKTMTMEAASAGHAFLDLYDLTGDKTYYDRALGIFDAKYRKYMGDFLITTGLMIIPVFIASLFMIVPGIVLSIAWSLAYFFLFEKKKNPMQAISASNEATYGSKWTMFFVLLAFVVAAYVIAGIFAWICAAIDVGFITFVVMLALVAVIMSISLAINASFWRQLKDNVQ